MASITIRNLDDKVKTRLRILAAGHGRSMEEEARLILAGAVEQDLTPERGLGTTLHQLFKPLGDVDLKLPQREPMPGRWWRCSTSGAVIVTLLLTSWNDIG